jgi:hypothetical protein
MNDRGQLGRELEQVTTDLRSQPQKFQRAARLRGLEPARHSVPASTGHARDREVSKELIHSAATLGGVDRGDTELLRNGERGA